MSVKAVRLIVPRDYTEIKSWYLKREKKAPEESTLPSLGVISPQGAAGWLIPTQGSFAIIEGLISNPSANKGYREQATRSVIRRLIALAKAHGFKQILGFTQLDVVLAYGKDYGFQDIGSYRLMVKEL